MTNDIHARARELMLDGAAGLLSTAETTELMRHLAECEACRAEQDELSSSVSVFKKASAVTAPPLLPSSMFPVFGSRRKFKDCATTRTRSAAGLKSMS